MSSDFRPTRYTRNDFLSGTLPSRPVRLGSRSYWQLCAGTFADSANLIYSRALTRYALSWGKGLLP
jgi:hypothetical protein